MPITFTGLDALPRGEPRPVVAALVELGSALHALGDVTAAGPDRAGHHDADAALARMRDALGPDLVAEATTWAWTTAAIRSRPFLEPDAPGPGLGPALDRLAALDRRELAARLLRPITPHGRGTTAVEWAAVREPPVQELVACLVTAPADGVARFLRFLRAVQDAWFDAEWRTLRPVLAERARRFARTRDRHGPVRAVLELDPAFGPARATGTVTLAKVAVARHDVPRRGLLVAPSAYLGPHVYVADVPGRPLLVLHPATTPPDTARDGAAAVPSVTELRQRAGVLASRSRLEVARAIASEPRTAREIATLWGVDATLVTRHLRALAAAGFATTERRGRYVRYRLDPGAVRALGDDLVALLLR